MSILAWLGLLAFAAVAPVLVATFVFPEGSPNRDDVGYLSQAAALRAGDLTLPASTHEPDFMPYLSGRNGDCVVFKYQPAWPALIAVSEGVTGDPRPALAVTGATSVAAVAALTIEVTRRRRAALIAGYVYASSPWFVVQSGTYLAYPASAAVLCGATALLLRGVRTASTPLVVAAGAAMGLAALHRPYDAALGFLPLLAWLLAERRCSRALVTDVGRIAIGASPFAVAFLAYNRIVTGSFLTLAFSLVGPMDRFGFGARSSLADPGQPGAYDFTVGEAWRTVLAFAGSLPDWLPGGLLVVPLAYLGLRSLRDRRLAWLITAQGLIFPSGYFIWWGAANARAYRLHDLLGPLYWFPLLTSAAVLTGAGIDRLSRRRPSRFRSIPGGAVPAAGVAVLVLVSVGTASDTRRDLGVARFNQEAQVDALLPRTAGPSLVIAEPRFPGDLHVPVPVPPRLDGQHLVAMDPTGGLNRFDLLDRFPGRTVSEVIEIHRADEPFEGGVRTQRVLTVRSGRRIRLSAVLSGGGDPSMSVDGQSVPIMASGAEASATLVAQPTSGGIVVPSGDPVEIVIGVDDRELRWLARVRDGNVEVLGPPRPVRRYTFPGRGSFAVFEDIGDRIRPG